MPSSQSPTLLVIPAYRESQRLPKSFPELCAAIGAMEGDEVAVLVVDDGSGAEEARFVSELVAGMQEDYPFLLDPLLLDKNRGKGGAVYAGWDSVKADPQYETLGFVDSDGAVPAGEVVRLLAQLRGFDREKALYAARLHDGEHAVKRTLLRKWLGLLFRWLTRVSFRLPIHDSQCGCKLVPAQPYHAIRDQLTELRYCFDIDLTIHLLNTNVEIDEIPISWTEAAGTKLNLSQALKMLRSLWQLRKKAKRLRR